VQNDFDQKDLSHFKETNKSLNGITLLSEVPPGELPAIDLKKRSARISAAEPTLVGQLSSEDFHSLLFDCPGMALALLKRFPVSFAP
jgi:CRP-like cAMP-binding protein